MFDIIVIVIILLILVGLISKLVKKTREVRASFRNTFGGGEEKTREDATRIMTDASKNKVVPEWAIADAATELVKYNIGESQLDNQNQLMRNLLDLGYTIVDVPKDMAITRGTSKDAAQSIIKGYLSKLNAKHYKQKMELTEKDKKLIDRCKSAYYLGVTECTVEEAKEAVEYLVDQWKVDVEDGKIA